MMIMLVVTIITSYNVSKDFGMNEQEKNMNYPKA